LDIIIPLTYLIWKDIPSKFDSSCQDAFNSLKKAFTFTPILTYWIPDAQLIVETNASDYAFAAILSIVNEDTTSSPSSLKNNLQPPYKLLFFFSLLSVWLQLWIWTPYIKTSSQLSLVTQLLQNTSLQIASGLQTQTVYFSLTTEFMYYLLVTSVHTFSSIIMITSSLDILVKTKHWN